MTEPSLRAEPSLPVEPGFPTEPSDLTETRAGYDAVAGAYAEHARTDLDRQPLTRALFAAFAELVRAAGGGPVARRAYPGLRFDEGSMSALNRADGELGGIVAWYSVIHTPPERLPALFAEFHRVLAPGGYALLAFQVGDERLRVERAYGRAVSLDAYRLPPDRVADLLAQAGLAVVARLVREPDETEKVPQAHLLARRP